MREGLAGRQAGRQADGCGAARQPGSQPGRQKGSKHAANTQQTRSKHSHPSAAAQRTRLWQRGKGGAGDGAALHGLLLGEHANAAADCLRRQFVVPGDDHDADARGVAVLNGRPHLGAGRVLQARQPQKHHAALDGLVLGGVGQALLRLVAVAAIIVSQVTQALGLGGKGQQAQRAARQAVQQPAKAAAARRGQCQSRTKQAGEEEAAVLGGETRDEVHSMHPTPHTPHMHGIPPLLQRCRPAGLQSSVGPLRPARLKASPVQFLACRLVQVHHAAIPQHHLAAPLQHTLSST